MITREQYLEISLDITCKKNNINDDAYKVGFMDGAHCADNSMLNTFKLWVEYIAQHGLLQFHERGFQNEKEVIENFKSWLGYDSNKT